jgi:hypothetical protein
MRLMLARYLYDFPFLGDDSTITVDDNRFDPLYKHVFPPEVAPQLSFIGLPWKVSWCKIANSSALMQFVTYPMGL